MARNGPKWYRNGPFGTSRWSWGTCARFFRSTLSHNGKVLCLPGSEDPFRGVWAYQASSSNTVRGYGAYQAYTNNPFRWLWAFPASSNNPLQGFWAYQASSNNPFRGLWAIQASSNTVEAFLNSPFRWHWSSQASSNNPFHGPRKHSPPVRVCATLLATPYVGLRCQGRLKHHPT